MAAALATEGKRGVLCSAIYDNWWNGGNRTTPGRHNIVSVLTETASANLASPVFVRKADLLGGAKGFRRSSTGGQLYRSLARRLVAAARRG